MFGTEPPASKLMGELTLHTKSCPLEAPMCPGRFAVELRFTNRVMKVTRECSSHPRGAVIGPQGAWRRSLQGIRLSGA